MNKEEIERLAREYAEEIYEFSENPFKEDAICALYQRKEREMNPKDCKHFNIGKCYSPKTIKIIGRCSSCPLMYDMDLPCPDFTPKDK